MPELTKIKDKQFIVMGFSMTGCSVADFLIRHGANVTVTAREDLKEDPQAIELKQKGVTIVDKGHPLSLLDQPVDYIVKNPGIPYQVEFIQVAQDKNIPIITDVELAYWANNSQIIGITGSNGKTTTTQLIFELLEELETHQARLAGNIGVPIIETIEKSTENDFVVAELSSFQLQGTQLFRPNIAVINNIFEAHLDYHEKRANYIEAKLKLIANMTPNDILVYNYDQEEISEWIKSCPAHKIPFSSTKKDNFIIKNGTYVVDEIIYYKNEPVVGIADIQIPGEHNVMNVLAAISVVKNLNVSNDTITKVIRNYRGMPHRIQPLQNHEGRAFYNDSKATNIVATQTALNSFQQPIVYIGGGLDRGNGFDELIPNLNRVKAAFLYGETKYKMKEAFAKAGIKKIEICDDLQQATEEAYYFAEKGDVILLSPACASWDQFPNYELRGQTFIETVDSLIKNKPYTK